MSNKLSGSFTASDDRKNPETRWLCMRAVPPIQWLGWWFTKKTAMSKI